MSREMLQLAEALASEKTLKRKSYSKPLNSPSLLLPRKKPTASTWTCASKSTAIPANTKPSAAG